MLVAKTRYDKQTKGMVMEQSDEAHVSLGSIVKVYKSYGIKDDLKALGYQFNALGKSWDKKIATEAELTQVVKHLHKLVAPIWVIGANQSQLDSMLEQIYPSKKARKLKK